MSKEPFNQHPTGPVSPLEPRDVEVLAYIHSNKFITTRLFHKKFNPHQVFWTACRHLKALVDRGLLFKARNLPNEDSFYCLTRQALSYLSGLARILTSPEIRAPHINLFEREHDKRVLTIRIQVEEAGCLEGLTWLSDYEMRCGLKMTWKRALVEGRGWDLAGAKLHRVYSRTPDGYFEASIQGRDHCFVLEYEHTAYNRDKMAAMVLNLRREFPGIYRLVVSRDKEHAVRMYESLETFLKGDPRDRCLWGFSFFDKVVRLPFVRVPWVNMDGDYLPFVKDPILKATPIDPQVADQPEKESA